MSISLYPQESRLDRLKNSKTSENAFQPIQQHRIDDLHGSASQAYTLVELAAIICTIFIILLFGYIVLKSGKTAAFTITAKHDLVNYVEIMDDYFVQNDCFIGAVGHAVRNDGQPSDYTLKHFIPSEGVVITVIAGDPKDPYSPDNPYIVESRHAKGDTAFNYNFVDRGIVHKQVTHGK